MEVEETLQTNLNSLNKVVALPHVVDVLLLTIPWLYQFANGMEIKYALQITLLLANRLATLKINSPLQSVSINVNVSIWLFHKTNNNMIKHIIPVVVLMLNKCG